MHPRVWGRPDDPLLEPPNLTELARGMAPALGATAYFVGSEGLTNVLKHAHASQATVHARRVNGSLLVSVSDDGIGGADPQLGSGLLGLRDRIAAAGGQFSIESGTGGTRLTAELPCA